MQVHARTEDTLNRFISKKLAHPAVIEMQTRKMASELAEARELLVQIARCTNVNDAKLIAQTFLEMHPEEK